MSSGANIFRGARYKVVHDYHHATARPEREGDRGRETERDRQREREVTALYQLDDNASSRRVLHDPTRPAWYSGLCFAYIYIYIYTCMYVEAYIYIYMFIHTHTHTHTQLAAGLCFADCRRARNSGVGDLNLSSYHIHRISLDKGFPLINGFPLCIGFSLYTGFSFIRDFP